MNHSVLEKRIQSLKAKLDAMQPKQPPPLLVIAFDSRVHDLAPEGTRACDDDVDDLPNTFAMIPLGYRGPLPEGIPIFDFSMTGRRGDEQ